MIIFLKIKLKSINFRGVYTPGFSPIPDDLSIFFTDNIGVWTVFCHISIYEYVRMLLRISNII